MRFGMQTKFSIKYDDAIVVALAAVPIIHDISINFQSTGADEMALLGEQFRFQICEI